MPRANHSPDAEADKKSFPLVTVFRSARCAIEQGRSEPNQPTRAYLKVIAVDPEGTAAALQKSAA